MLAELMKIAKIKNMNSGIKSNFIRLVKLTLDNKFAFFLWTVDRLGRANML